MCARGHAGLLNLKNAARHRRALPETVTLSLPLFVLAACGGGSGGGGTIQTPQVVPPTLTPTTPPTVTAGQTGGSTGNVLPAANQTGTSAATISAFSESGGAAGTLGQAYTTSLGTLTLNSNGAFTFTVANNAAVKALPQGATQDVVINYTAGNSAGSANSTLRFTITGINDAPVAVNDAVTAPVIVTAPITGNVLTNDSDVDRGTTLTVTGIVALSPQVSQSVRTAQTSAQSGVAQNSLGTATVQGSYGSITIDSDGSYVYTLDKSDPDFMALRAGQTAVERFEYTLSDGQTGIATAALNITLTGVNDAPIVENATGAITEDATPNTATGTVTVTEFDNGQTASIVSVNGAAFSGIFTSYNGTYGTLGLNSTGAWTYTLDNSRAATQALQAGQQVSEVFTVTARDPLNATGSGTITITVTGENDLPVLQGETLTVFANDPNGTFNLLANDTDQDTGTILRISAINLGGIFTLGSGGFGSPIGTGGGFSISQNGVFNYSLNYGASNAPYGAFAALAPGEVYDSVYFSYSVTDGIITTPTDISDRNKEPVFRFRVIGVNDAPVVSTAIGAVTEDAIPNTSSGTVTVTDIDNGQAATISSVNGTAFVGSFTSFNGIYGTLGLNSSGAWTYTLDNSRAATQALQGGQQVTEVFTVTARDPLNATGSGNITITVTGTAEPGSTITANPDNAVALTEDSAVVASSGNALTNDIGTGLVVASVNGSSTAIGQSVSSIYGALVLSADGAYTYTLNNSDPDTNSLSAGQRVTETFSYNIRSSSGGTSQSTISVDIIGANDAPTVSNSAGAVTEDATPNSTTGSVSISDVDFNQTAAIASVNGIGFTGSFTSYSGLYGTLGLNSNGSWAYTLDNGRSATQALAAGQQVVETFTVTARDPLSATGTGNITINVTGANDTPSVSSATGSVTEDASPNTTNGSIVLSDADTGDVVRVINVNGSVFSGTSAIFNGTYGTLNLTSSGTWIYTLDNSRSATDNLIQGQQVHDIFTVQGSDQNNAAGSGAIDITVNGAGSTGSTVTLAPDTVTIPGTTFINLLANDQSSLPGLRLSSFEGMPISPGGSNFSSTQYLTYSAASNGGVTLGVRQSAYASLREGEVNITTFQYGAYNGTDGAFSTLTVRLVGVNDAPVMTVPGVINVSRYVDLNLSLPAPTDPDSPTLQITFSALPTGGTLRTSSGTIVSSTTVLDASDIPGLYFTPISGVTAPGSLVLQVADGDGATITRSISLNFFANEIVGTASNDLLTGTSASEVFHGLAGNDRFVTDGIGDIFLGGSGTDSVDFSAAISGLVSSLLDTSTYNSIERLLGSSLDDNLTGDGGNNFLLGRAGDDQLQGNDGNDVLIGAAGRDILIGGNGNDLLVDGDGLLFGTSTSNSAISIMEGGNGDDLLVIQAGNYSTGSYPSPDYYAYQIAVGGTGADTFILATEGISGPFVNLRARINDFHWTENDKIDLSDLFDSTGAALDFSDILAGISHFTDPGGPESSRIELTAYSSVGIQVSVDLLIFGAGSSQALNPNFFIFSGGVDWAAQLPVDVPVY